MIYVTIHIRLGRDRRWRADGVEVTAPPGPSAGGNLASLDAVDPADLRFVSEHLVATVELAVSLLPKMFDLRSGSHVQADAETAWPHAVRRRQRRRELSRELLLDVAAIYSGAVRLPRRAVADHFGVSPATASRWIAEAREQRLLPSQSEGTA